MKSLAIFITTILITSVSTVFAQDRVSEDLEVLFGFTEGIGEYVYDQSGNDNPTILKIHNLDNVNWLTNGGLQFTGSARASSLLPATSTNHSIQSSNEITLEAWIESENITQEGPARIMTLSHNSTQRNATLGQDEDKYIVRTRTTETDDNGMPQSTIAGEANTELQHVVYTKDNNGIEVVYVNGEQVFTGTRLGNTNNWANTYHFGVGNEINAERPWLGTIFLSAVYSKALTAEEVQTNFNFGHQLEGPEVSTEMCEEETCFVDGFGSDKRSLWIPNLPNDVFKEFKFDANGGSFDRFEDGTAHLYGQCVNMENPNYGWYMDLWFTERMDWDEWSSLGRSWKGSTSVVGDFFETWDYYIMDPEKANVLIGTGLYEGSQLDLTHKPDDYYYGMQFGEGANDQNAKPGLSCWFYFTGTIDGEYIEGHGDVNMEGECDTMPVMQCAVDVEVDCENGGYDPEITGSPIIFCPNEYTLSYEDEIVSGDCPLVIIRHWTAINELGEEVSCDQNITVVDNTPPYIASPSIVLNSCDIEAEVIALVEDHCDSNPQVEITVVSNNDISGTDCDPGQLRTQTMGGWGTNPNGNNPGVYLDANFDNAFPNGLTIGCENTLKLTSAQAVRDFLPSGSTASPLPAGELLNPGAAYTNVLAGQLVAATLSVTFDSYDADFGDSDFALDQTIIQSGSFEGMTVTELLNIANAIIGGCSTEYSAGDINDALSSINENYVDGTSNEGFLGCGESYDCAILQEILITATDNCGNSATWTQEVIIIDEEAPVIELNDLELTVSCTDFPEPETPFILDCFAEDVVVEVSDQEFSGACLPVTQRTYTATDPCGNSSSVVQYIYLVDEVAPIFTNNPEDATISCGEELPEFTPVAIDECSEVIISYDEAVVFEDCGQTITRIWTAIDLCGNSAELTQNVTVIDDTPPTVVNEIGAIYTDCNNIPEPVEPEFIDDCSEVVSVIYQEESFGEGCEYIIQRSWAVADACGNIATIDQSVFVSDETPPVFVSVPEDTMTDCGETLEVGEVIATDNCGSVTIEFNEVVQEIEGDCNQIVRTWTATDECGNASSAQQNILLVDTEAPMLLNVPEDVFTSCGEIDFSNSVTAVDNCDGIIEVFYSEIVDGIGCNITIIRSWTATDGCGNSVTASQLIDVMDEEVPVITGPAEISVECSELLQDNLITVEDDCDFAVEVSFTDEILGNNCNQIIARLWTATDACGNTAEFQQVITVLDETGPAVVTMPADLELNCGADLPEIVEPTFVDACSDFEIEFFETYEPSSCGDVLVRNWTAIDECGNETSVSQTISFIDTEAPAFVSVVENIVLSCLDEIPTASNIFATDNCSDPTIELVEVVNPGPCANSYSIQRIWTATDNCGNSSNLIQTISVVDEVPPTFDNQPEDITAECGFIPEPPVVTATDLCSENVTILYEEDAAAGGCPNITRTWTAIDDCGNSTAMIQTVYILDTEPPVMEGIPSDVEVVCNNIPEMPEPEASDNCDDEVAITVNESIVGEGCSFTIIRTWIASDDCGNTTIASQSITVTDEEAPVFVDAPGEITIECSQLNDMNYPTVTDDCAGTINITFVDDVMGEGCSYDINRTYTATDLCGNTATAEQLIHVVDTTVPTIYGVPANTYVSCDEIPEPVMVTAIDDCGGEVDVVWTEQAFGEGCEYILNRTYTATDACGNAVSVAQLIYVQDGQAPEISGVETDLAIDCDQEIPEPVNPVVTDNCDNEPTLNYVEFTETNDCGEIITRIWTASDDCGNTSSVTRIISRVDLTPPLISDAPSDIETSCDAIPEPVMPTAVDACGGEVFLSVDEEVITGECPYYIVRVYSATDQCGNSTSVTQTITVVDNDPPVLANLPSDATGLTCGQVPGPAAVIASDNCVADLNVMVEETSSFEGCVETITRTYTATDLCGNVAQHVQTLVLNDNDAPFFMEMPADMTISCVELEPLTMIAAFDACGIVDQQMDEYITETECATEFEVLRIWTVTDACGQSATHSQVIQVVDDVAPILSGLPEDMTVSCGEIPEVADVTVTDGCNETLEIEFSEESILLEAEDNICELENAVGEAGEVVLWLPNLSGFGSNYVFNEEAGIIEMNEEMGTAHITGTVYNPFNMEEIWIIDLYLKDQMNWEEWSALGRGYKDDANVAGDNYLDWSFFLVDETSSRLVGQGDFLGSVLELSHAPSDFQYGFQLGVGANNRNAEYGISGWFHYSGMVAGEEVSGAGDVMTENNCCADEEIIRTWTVTDCAGNTTTYTQTITVSSDAIIPEIPVIDLGDDLGVFEVTGTAGNEFSINFEAEETETISIEMYNLSGVLIDVIAEMEVYEGAVYSLRYPKDLLPAGSYVFVMRGQNNASSDWDIVGD